MRCESRLHVTVTLIQKHTTRTAFTLLTIEPSWQRRILRATLPHLQGAFGEQINMHRHLIFKSTTDSTRIDFGKEVVVLVGGSEKRFVCHANLLTAQSPFFEAALSGRWLESEEKLVRLPEQAPTAFSIYLNWRYTGAVDLSDGEDNAGTYTTPEGAIKENQGPRFSRLVRCSVLADMLQDHAFSNALIDSYFDLVEITYQFPSSTAVNLAFQLLAEGSWVRRLFIRQLAFDANAYELSQRINEHDFQVVSAIAVLSIMERGVPMKDKRIRAKRQSMYHNPAEGKKK